MTEIKRLVEQDQKQLNDETGFGHSVLHLAFGWPEDLELLLVLGGKGLINDGDARGGSPLAYACVQHHFDCAGILMSNDCRIDANLLFLAIRKHGRGNTKILEHLLPELIRRRKQLVRFAEYHLGKSFIDSLGIPLDAVPDQWAVFKIQEACQNNKTPVPEKMRHSNEGLTKYQQRVVWDSIFGFSEFYNPSFMELLWSAGFRVRPDLSPWTLGLNRGPGKDILDQVDWYICHGYDVYSQFAHDATSFMAHTGDNDGPFGFDVKTDTHSTKKRAETLEKIYFPSYSMDHHCPCSTEGCIAATASLVRTPAYVRFCEMDSLLWAMLAMESTIQFSPEAAESGVLETATVSSRSQGPPDGLPSCRLCGRFGWEGRHYWYCRGRAQCTVWQKEKWIELSSKLTRAYLFQFFGLTHSLSCCKADLSKEGSPNKWGAFVCLYDEDTIKERQEEEKPRVAKLETLVRESVDGFKSEPMRLTMSRFLEEVAKPRAEKLMEGWK